MNHLSSKPMKGKGSRLMRIKSSLNPNHFFLAYYQKVMGIKEIYRECSIIITNPNPRYRDLNSDNRSVADYLCHLQFSSVQSLSRVWLFATPWIAAGQASLSITNSQSSLKLTSIESVMPPSHLILCHPLLLLAPIPPSIRVFPNESTLRMRWSKSWFHL